MNRWRIELFGGLQVQHGDRVLSRFATRKTGALLGYLAYHLGQNIPRSVLIEIFWEDKEPAQGSQSLRHALSSLRRQLEPPGTSPGTVIEADRFRVRLNFDTVTTDVAEFNAAIQAAASSRSSSERILHFTRAVQLYRGELMPGYYENWILPEQLKLEEQFFQAIESLLQLWEEEGEYERAIAAAQGAVKIDPLREEIHLALMRLYIVAGQSAVALHQFAELETLMRERLGAAPCSAAVELADLIRAGSLLPQEQVRVRTLPDETAPGRTKKRTGSPPALSGGVLTFLMMELPGSPEGTALGAAWLRVQGVLRELLRRHGGQEMRSTGNSLIAVFPGPRAAFEYLHSCMPSLAADGLPEHVRTALHTGDVDAGENLIPFLYAMLSAAHEGQTLCSESTAVLMRSHLNEGVQLQDIGVYCLPGHSVPERLFQLSLSGSPVFPPLTAERATQGNLPIQLTRFFGRETEIEQLTALLIDSRLITLTGSGGSGKTRLAVEIGKRFWGNFEGGIWFISFQDLSDSSQVAGVIRDTLGLPLLGGVNALDQVVHLVSRQPTLFILDNMEHLLPQGVDIVETLLKRSERLSCLVTSRQRLNLPGEREFPVLPLPVPASGFGDLKDGSNYFASATSSPLLPLPVLLTFPSVQLFVDRAQARQPDFQLTPGNAEAITELCRGLEGVPLAIELAATRIRVMSPAQMLHRFSRRFEWLATARDDVPQRHRTLQAALDWSYQSLPFELQRFLSLLTIFRGGWTLATVEAILQEPRSLDYLERLQDASLIVSDMGQDEPRFRLLETIREYAAEHLKQEELSFYRARHADYFSKLMEETVSFVEHGSAKRLAHLEREHDNLRAALEWYEETANVEAGLGLASALVPFRLRRGYALEGMMWLDRFLNRGKTSPKLRAKALHAYSLLALTMGNQERVKEVIEESLRIYRQLGDKKGIAGCLYQLGQWYRGVGEFQAEKAIYEEGLGLQAEIGDERLHSRFLIALAWHCKNFGDYAGAIDYGERSLRLSREIGDEDAEASCLNFLGIMLSYRGDLEGSRDYCEKSVALYEKTGNKQGLIYALTNLGLAYGYLGDYERAFQTHEQCLDMERASGDRGGIAISLHNIAMIVSEQGDYRKAEALYQEALQINQELGRRSMELHNLLGLAETALLQKDYSKARPLYEQGLAAAKESGYKNSITIALRGLGQVACRSGDFISSQAWLEELMHCCQEMGEPLGVAETLRTYAELAATRGDHRQAVILSGASLSVRDASGVSFTVDEQDEDNRFLAVLRQALGKAAFEEAFNTGLAFTQEEAIEFALNM